MFIKFGLKKRRICPKKSQLLQNTYVCESLLNFEAAGAVQNCEELVELENCCKMSICRSRLRCSLERAVQNSIVQVTDHLCSTLLLRAQLTLEFLVLLLEVRQQQLNQQEVAEVVHAEGPLLAFLL